MVITERLKKETRNLHDEVEEAMGAKRIFSPGYSRDEYITLLQKLWKAHTAIEPSVLSFFRQEKSEDIMPETRFNRRKLLEKDLQEAEAAPPPSTGAIELSSFYEALGAAYVLEGSTLGGSVILKQVRKYNWEGLHFHYYNCYGEDIGKMWMDFKKYLEKNVTSEKVSDEVIRGAEKAYSVFLLT